MKNNEETNNFRWSECLIVSMSFPGYYADEGAGCQVFHVCDGSFLVSSFLCPIGSIFSQKLLTCDWWNKVDCSLTRNYHVTNIESHVSEVDDDEILRKAFEMSRVESAGERIPIETVIEKQARPDDRGNQRVFNYGGSSVTERTNDLPTGRESYSDYPDYPSRHSSRYKSRTTENPQQRYQDNDYYSQNVGTSDRNRNSGNPSIQIHTIGEDRKNDRHGSFRNEFQPSYAPTVPTVTTIARRFYSPTIPTTYRPPTTKDTFGRYDLEFESSDHLYTARGRSDETVKAATPAPIPNENQLANSNPPTATFQNLDDTEKLKISQKTEPPIDLPSRNFTFGQSLNETMESLDRKEKTITQDLDRLTEKITETLSILTIDEKHRDPTVFSYNHEEDTSNGQLNIQHIPQPSVIVNSTNSSRPANAQDPDKPAEFLLPPKENQSEFRIMILDESSIKNTRKFSNPNQNSAQNSTGNDQSVRTPKIMKKSPLPNDEKQNRESRIFRIVIGNNSTAPESSEELKTPKIFIQKVKSIDSSPQDFLSPIPFTETTTISERSEEITEIAETLNASSLNSTKSVEFVPGSFDSEDGTQGTDIPQTVDSIEDVHENLLEKDSIKMSENSSALEMDSATSPSENVAVDLPILREQVLTNSSKIPDAIELASSPVEFTLTVNENEEIDPNGEEIRKLIAQPEVGDSIGAADFKSFEIVRSDEHNSPRPNAESNDFHSRRLKIEEARTKEENVQIPKSNVLQSMKYLESFATLINGPNSPRPFSLEQPVSPEIQTPSNPEDEIVSIGSQAFSNTQKNFVVSETTDSSIRSTGSIAPSVREADLEENVETLKTAPSGLTTDFENNRALIDQLSQTFGPKNQKTNQQKLVFDLPESTRFYNFETGLPLADSEESSPQSEQQTQRSNETDPKIGETHTETVIQTEFIPSLGFSLNTDEEREEYMEAVEKGLLHDVATVITTNNENTTSIET